MTVQSNAIDILTKCDELRKQFMPMRWEVRGLAYVYIAVCILKAININIHRDFEIVVARRRLQARQLAFTDPRGICATW